MERTFTRVFLLFIFLLFVGRGFCSALGRRRESQDDGLCADLIRPLGFPCIEYMVETNDGYRLAVQRLPYGRNGITVKPGPPVFLQHGLFQGGDTWFVNPIEQSLGFILADYGFDVWVGNVRGTRWSYGHVTFSEKEKEFWDWSWQELVQYDLADMINFVYSETSSKVFLVGHSQGTIMALASFTRPYVVEMVAAAALLCPISYLGHINSHFVLRAVNMHLDQMLLAMGIHQLNFRSNIGVQILESICDGHAECSDLLSSITGQNCCFNNSRVDFYLNYEPHPSSTKNLKHLFQMIRKGAFSMFDYGLLGNLKRYGTPHPRSFNLTEIPKSLPLWMAYGGTDALADLADFNHTRRELQSEPELLYQELYGHMDFIWGTNAKFNVYDKMIEFFRLQGRSSY